METLYRWHGIKLACNMPVIYQTHSASKREKKTASSEDRSDYPSLVRLVSCPLHHALLLRIGGKLQYIYCFPGYASKKIGKEISQICGTQFLAKVSFLTVRAWQKHNIIYNIYIWSVLRCCWVRFTKTELRDFVWFSTDLLCFSARKSAQRTWEYPAYQGSPWPRFHDTHEGQNPRSNFKGRALARQASFFVTLTN